MSQYWKNLDGLDEYMLNPERKSIKADELGILFGTGAREILHTFEGGVVFRYTERLYAVAYNKRVDINDLKALDAMYNPNLSYDGVNFQGFLFPFSKYKDLDDFLNGEKSPLKIKLQDTGVNAPLFEYLSNKEAQPEPQESEETAQEEDEIEDTTSDSQEEESSSEPEEIPKKEEQPKQPKAVSKKQEPTPKKQEEEEQEEQTPVIPPKPASIPKIPKKSEEKMMSDFDKIRDDIQLGNNVFLYGGAGTGKTTVANLVAEDLGRGVQTINCSQWTSPIEIVGGQTLEGYQEGKMIEAWKRGEMLILDEMPKIDPNTAGLFNEALAKAAEPMKFNEKEEVLKEVSKVFDKKVTGQVEFLMEQNKPEDAYFYLENSLLSKYKAKSIKDLSKKDKKEYFDALDALMLEVYSKPYVQNTRKDKFIKHPHFCVIATGNVYPNTQSAAYGANNKQDLSLLDRFVGSVYRVEKNPDLEKKIVGIFWLWQIWDSMRTMIEAEKWEAQVSLRIMLSSLRVYLLEMERFRRKDPRLETGKTLKDVVDSFVTSGFTKEQTSKLKDAVLYDMEIDKYQYRKK